MQTLIAAIGLPAAIMLSVVVGLIISSTLSALVVLATSLLRRLRHSRRQGRGFVVRNAESDDGREGCCRHARHPRRQRALS